ncbi:MAG TPA: M48 family metallopeptidase [Geobacteraceae bacterium]|nr:M48 family metallopeptidase [Geobacteraceae bacterium]
MNEVTAGYYDGVVSMRHDVRLSIEGTALRVRGDGTDALYPLEQLRVSTGVGSVRRRIRLPGGGACEVDDESFVTALERLQGKGTVSRLIHRWEKSIPLVLTALVLTTLGVTLFMKFGIPALARKVAFTLPADVQSSLGKDSLAMLDRMVFTPSGLPPERRAGLTALFKRMTSTLPGTAGCRLEFRSSRSLGANALALPSGIVIITDDLVKLARNDDEIAAVLAHELGHVQGRHALRQVLQNSAATLVIASLTGDIVSITSLSATIPTTLVNASFSRDFEREADNAAIAYMRRENIPLRSYADILSRLQAQIDARRGETSGNGDKFRNYLSTHPDTAERIRMITAQENIGKEKR